MKQVQILENFEERGGKFNFQIKCPILKKNLDILQI